MHSGKEFLMMHMTLSGEIALVMGAIGVVLTVLSDLMKRMIPLRLFAIVANVAFGLHNVLVADWINTTLQVVLLAVNVYRLWDLQRMLAAIENARVDTPVHEWLLPYTTKKIFGPGHVLFAKGDVAHEIIYVSEGTVRIAESGHTLGVGALVGEIGLFSADHKRTATIVCETRCVCHTMTDEAIHLLYFQNPELGFYLIRLVVQRLLQDLQRNDPTIDPVASP